MNYRIEVAANLISKYIGYSYSEHLNNLSLKDIQDKLSEANEPIIELIPMSEFPKLEKYGLYEIERVMDFKLFNSNLKILKSMIKNGNMCDIYCLPYMFIDILLKYQFDIFGLIELGYAKPKIFDL